MNIRDNIIQVMYNMANSNPDKGMKESFDNLNRFVNEIFGEETDEAYQIKLMACYIERAAFYAGANMVFELIAGEKG